METLLLFVYFLVVFYVLYQMALDLERRQEDRVKIHLDYDFLASQTQDQLNFQKGAKHIRAVVSTLSFGKLQFTALQFSIAPKDRQQALNSPFAKERRQEGWDDDEILKLLTGNISVRLMPIGQQKLRPISLLTVIVENRTMDSHVYVNWDHSSLEMFNEANRIIRSVPNMPRDLTQPQIYSLVNPESSLTASVTVEKNYAYNPKTDRMTLADNLVDLADRVEMSKMTDPTTEEKNIQPLYTLDLMVGIKHVTDPNSELINLLMPFKFTLEIEPDKIALPPLRWLLRRFGKRNRPDTGSWFWGQ
ncbi:MAG: hypothetical protein AAFQ63_03010 [Cyanobacteria bacterium J06621_11]